MTTEPSAVPTRTNYCFNLLGHPCSLLKEKRIKASARMKQLSQKVRQQRLQVRAAGQSISSGGRAVA